MIKVLARRKGGKPPLVILGLTGENITRLIAGEPISINLSEMGLPDCPLGIVYGKTEDDIVAELAKFGVNIP